jgi:molecular chaperone IbpA
VRSNRIARGICQSFAACKKIWRHLEFFPSITKSINVSRLKGSFITLLILKGGFFMTTAFSLTPLLRSTVGFDHFNELFESLRDSDEVSYPPYNIEKHGEDRYGITMAVAGFTEQDLTITSERDRLVVAGRTAPVQDRDSEYLYRGIAARPFERVFRLADHMKVVGAELRHGLLRIELLREIPEEQKPRTIAINIANDTKAIEHAANTAKDRKKVA